MEGLVGKTDKGTADGGEMGLIEKEKVIKRIKAQIAVCKEIDSDWISLTVGTGKRILELLEEQEAVKPTLIREGRNKNYNDYVCPRCDNEVVYEQNYCSECGVRFLWEGR
jgi:DNA-directed RNA polymerase subunit RPC12/RpoP